MQVLFQKSEEGGVMKKKVLCESCSYWVDCKRPTSFCLVEDLFTPTARTECPNWEKGVPITEEEWEKAQEGCLD